VSEWLALTIAMTAAGAVVVIVVALRQRRIADDDDPSETPDVIEYMTMMVGVIYAIVLGLAIAGVWEARDSAQSDALQEAQSLHEISERVQVYPADVRDRTRADVDAYVRYVVHTEWQDMADHGSITPQGTALLEKVRRDVSDYVPRNDRESQAYQPLVDQVTAVDQARSARNENAGATLPGVVWFGLVVGALVTVGLIFTLQIRRSPRELLLAGLFSALIAFLLFLIWDFDAPFARGMTATANPFLDVFPYLGG
jgi:hypothetical protein